MLKKTNIAVEREDFIHNTLEALELIIDEGYTTPYTLVEYMSEELRETLLAALHAKNMDDGVSSDLDFEGDSRYV